LLLLLLACLLLLPLLLLLLLLLPLLLLAAAACRRCRRCAAAAACCCWARGNTSKKSTKTSCSSRVVELGNFGQVRAFDFSLLNFGPWTPLRTWKWLFGEKAQHLPNVTSDFLFYL
jgi:hypothetical protein